MSQMIRDKQAVADNEPLPNRTRSGTLTSSKPPAQNQSTADDLVDLDDPGPPDPGINQNVISSGGGYIETPVGRGPGTALGPRTLEMDPIPTETEIAVNYSVICDTIDRYTEDAQPNMSADHLNTQSVAIEQQIMKFFNECELAQYGEAGLRKLELLGKLANARLAVKNKLETNHNDSVVLMESTEPGENQGETIPDDAQGATPPSPNHQVEPLTLTGGENETSSKATHGNPPPIPALQLESINITGEGESPPKTLQQAIDLLSEMVEAQPGNEVVQLLQVILPMISDSRRHTESVLSEQRDQTIHKFEMQEKLLEIENKMRSLESEQNRFKVSVRSNQSRLDCAETKINSFESRINSVANQLSDGIANINRQVADNFASIRRDILTLDHNIKENIRRIDALSSSREDDNPVTSHEVRMDPPPQCAGSAPNSVDQIRPISAMSVIPGPGTNPNPNTRGRPDIRLNSTTRVSATTRRLSSSHSPPPGGIAAENFTEMAFEDPESNLRVFTEQNITRIVKSIKTLMRKEYNEDSTDIDVKAGHDSTIPSLNKLIESLEKATTGYMKFSSRNRSIASTAQNTLSTASDYIDNIRTLYDQLQLQLTQRDNGIKIKIETFSGTGGHYCNF
jgi:hypothetical protein